MPTSQTIVRDTYLTNYGRGIYPDVKPVMDLADKIAPRVLTGTASGKFNIFEDLQAFQTYDTKRALGGKANRIAFLTTTGTFDCSPQALEVAIDDAELAKAGDERLLREAKTRTLLLNAANSHLKQVCEAAVASATAATSGAGKWSTDTVDPIKEIDTEIQAIFEATGLVPNRLVMDLATWIIVRNNAKTLSRFQGLSAAPTIDQVKGLFATPLELIITPAAIASGIGNKSGKVKSALGAKRALLFYASDTATQYDPSFCKTFTTDLQLFEGIGTYDEPRMQIVSADWTADIKVTAAKLGRLIEVS